MRLNLSAFGAVILCGLVSSHAWAAGDPVRGEEIYQSRCIACHSPDAHRVGPKHRGIIGRTAGSAAGYDYSPALIASQLVWDETNLNRWLSDPDSIIPGQRMGYRTVSAEDRLDLIAFLRSLTR